ncbi:hypothetical protein ACWCWQ_07145 [Streptomyces sp. NPDC001571]|uniref:hypothetical protein n=1 Tax=Streptomyces sp. NPDC059819 TaxID=3346963 RepID=UPI0036655214
MPTTLPRRSSAVPGIALACLLLLTACGEDSDHATAPTDNTSVVPAGPGTCDESKPAGAGAWKPVLTEFRSYLEASGPPDAKDHVKDANLRDCPGGDREANVLTDYDPHLEAPHVDAETKNRADRVAQAFTEWRDQKFHDEGWVYVINGAVETVTKRAW